MSIMQESQAHDTDHLQAWWSCEVSVVNVCCAMLWYESTSVGASSSE